MVPSERAKSPPHGGSDIDLQVSFLAIEGKADMGGGLMWRAADDRLLSDTS